MVILVCESKTAEMGAVASYGASVAYNTNPAGKNPLTVEAGSSEGTYSFKTSDNKYLSWSTGNTLNLSETKNANSSWSVSFSGNNVLINNANDATRKLRYNASSPRFACYTSEQTAIQLYKAIAAAVTAPTITPDSQSFLNELEVTITPAEGTTMYYTTNGDDPTNSSTGYITAQTITLNATATVKAVSYNGNDHSAIVSETYTKLGNIEDITESGQTCFVKGTVVAKSARGFVLGDGTGYVYYYKGSDPGHNVEDVITLYGTTSSYNHVIQFPDGTTIADATNSNYHNTPDVQVLDADGILAYNSGLHLSDYVQIQGTLRITTNNNGNTYYNIEVADLDNEASISYPTSDQATVLAALENRVVIVKGYFAGVSSGHFNVVLESVEEVVSTTPEIDATAGSALAYDATTGNITYEIAN